MYKHVLDNSWPHKGLMRIDIAGMTHDQFSSVRSQLGTIGGSDMGAILGLNRYVSPRVLFYRMAGIAPPRRQEDRLHLSFGHLLEKGVAAAWRCYDDDEQQMARRITALKFGARDPAMGRCTGVDAIIINPKMRWLHASIDFRIAFAPSATRAWLDEDIRDGILECKNISARVSDMYVDGIPPYYRPQVLTYMAVTGAHYAEIAAIVGGNSMVVRPFLREELEEEIARVVELSGEFFAGMQQAKKVVDAHMEKHPAAKPHDGERITAAGEVLIGQVDEFVPSWVDDMTEEYLQFMTERHLLHLDMSAHVGEDDEVAQLAQKVDELGEAVRQRKELQDRIKVLMAQRGFSVIHTPTHTVTWNKSLRVTKKKSIV